MSIDESDKEKLQTLSENQQKVWSIIDDPVDKPPEWDLHRGEITKEMSELMIRQADGGSLRATADKFNVDLRTVQNHVNGEIKFEDVTYIDRSRCSVMRIMAHDGKSMREIAGRFGCSATTVKEHVSGTATGQKCSHDVNVDRVEY